MKLAPVQRALSTYAEVDHVVVHTGQHYDHNMSEAFFEDLGIAAPHLNLAIGSGSHAQQTAAIMQRFEPACEEIRPDLVLVYGDVNSTVAAALVAAKLGIRVGHVEAGLRSGDWTMPEEINRVVTDRLSDLLFTPSRDGDANLLAEGMPANRIHFVGNSMVDSLVFALPRARKIATAQRFGLSPAGFVVATLHRPSNVDEPSTLGELLDALTTVAKDRPVVWPVHPRTRERIGALEPGRRAKGDVRLIDPVGYLEMLSLVGSAEMVITDSGGLQEETSYLGVPCITVRPNTERPITCTHGTNQLVPPEREALLAAVESAPERRMPGGATIERWDGKAAERIAQVLCAEA